MLLEVDSNFGAVFPTRSGIVGTTADLQQFGNEKLDDSGETANPLAKC
jgi:hypothetical protein